MSVSNNIIQQTDVNDNPQYSIMENPAAQTAASETEQQRKDRIFREHYERAKSYNRESAAKREDARLRGEILSAEEAKAAYDAA